MTDSSEFTTLGSVVTRTGGQLQTGPFGSQLHASDYQSTGTPLVMPVNLGDNEIREGGIARIGASDVRRLRRHALRDGDIVFSRRGDVGRRSLVREKEAGWLCGTGCLAARFGTDRTAVNPAYVAEYIGSNAAQTWLVDNAVGGTMPNLNTGILAALPVLLPPKCKQDHIVSAFSDVQQAIKTLERLIAKKQAIKQGMMQQLLTGRTRLPGLEGAWKRQRISELIDGLTAGVSVRSTTAAYGSAILKTSCVDSGRFVPIEAKPILPADRSRARCNPVGGSLIISRMNTPSLVGDVGYVRETRLDLFLPDRLWIAQSKRGISTDMRWLTYYFTSERGARLLRAMATGTSGSMKNIPKKLLLSLEIDVPSEIEQRAIADVLQDVDEEIILIDARLAKARTVKAGMMQQLLTGRASVAVGDES